MVWMLLVFADARLKCYQKSIQLHAPLSVKLKKIIDIPLLRSIVEQCDYTYMGQIFKCVYLFSFYSFLHMFNLVPHPIYAFSLLRHLARGDLIFKPNKVVKWSKTMQCNNKIKLIHVPRIPRSSICPVAALSNLLALTPSGANRSPFQYKLGQEWVSLTDTKVRKHLNLLLTKIGIGWLWLHITHSGVQVPPLLLTMM